MGIEKQQKASYFDSNFMLNLMSQSTAFNLNILIGI